MKAWKHLLLIFTVVVISKTLAAYQNPKYPTETQAVQALAQKYDADVEVRLWDKTRVDLVNFRYAIEADWAYKWAEGIGQALYYAEVTKKKPAVMLLVKDMKYEAKYIYRCQTVCSKYDIKLYVEKVDPL